MKINVDNLNNGFSKEVNFEGDINLPDDASFNSKAHVKGTGIITNSSGQYTFTGKAISEVTCICNTCLEEFSEVIELNDIIEVFSKTEEKFEDYDCDQDSIWFFSSKDNNIILDQPIITNILLSMPMKALCIDNCKGLCKVCGHNLNINDCGCDRDFIDPRFESFLHLFPK